MLHGEGINYEYEPEPFELSSGITYTPDFVIDDMVIEVKVPCDIFIDWKSRFTLLDILQKLL